MKVVFTGSRNVKTGLYNIYRVRDTIQDLLDCLALEEELVIIEGGAKGLDSLVKEVYNLYFANADYIKHIRVPAKWDLYGKAAGHLRNSEMLNLEPDSVIAYLEDGSKGTANCIKQAKERGIPVEIINLDESWF